MDDGRGWGQEKKRGRERISPCYIDFILSATIFRAKREEFITLEGNSTSFTIPKLNRTTPGFGGGEPWGKENVHLQLLAAVVADLLAVLSTSLLLLLASTLTPSFQIIQLLLLQKMFLKKEKKKKTAEKRITWMLPSFAKMIFFLTKESLKV